MYALLIYADHAATTEVSACALAAAMPFFREAYGNASSRYALGRGAHQAVERARRETAEAIGAAAGEITFTSGGSEGNNAVLRGAVAKARSLGEASPHIVVSAIEHASILTTCRAMEHDGVRVTCLPVSRDGRVAPESVRAAVRKETRLVSVMLANNEVGTVQDIAGVAAALAGTGVPLHTDAVQAVGHIPVDVCALGVSYLTASGHKFHAMKGTGFLYQRRGMELPPLITGGGQENGHRAGTENVAGIVALGAALAESMERMAAERERLSHLVGWTAREVCSRIKDVRVNGAGGAHLPGTLNLGIKGVRGEALVHLLGQKGICTSTASACSAGRDAPSHVLLAMGQEAKEAMETLRISYGRQNSGKDARDVVDAIVWAVGKIRMALASA